MMTSVDKHDDYAGGWANRPRNAPSCTINGYLVLCILLLCIRTVKIWNAALVDEAIDIQIPELGLWTFRDVFFAFKVFGWDFDFSINVPLKKKAKSVISDFLENTKLAYLGIHRIKPLNVSGILHPVDTFIKSFYERFYVKQSAFAFSKYKRTNPTLPLRLNQLEKFSEPHVDDVPINELNYAVDSILTEVFAAEWFDTMRLDLRKSIDGRNFEDLNIDGSSAAGYPYRQD
eukprot:113142_1